MGRIDDKIEMQRKRYKEERLICKHVVAEAYKAGIITRGVRVADPHALLLPGRESNWQNYVAAKSGTFKIKKALPDLEEATRLHPPINTLVKELCSGVTTKGANPKTYHKWVQTIIKEWKERGRSPAGPQLVNKTLIITEGKKGQLFLHYDDSQEKIRFVVSAELFKVRGEKS